MTKKSTVPTTRKSTSQRKVATKKPSTAAQTPIGKASDDAVPSLANPAGHTVEVRPLSPIEEAVDVPPQRTAAEQAAILLVDALTDSGLGMMASRLYSRTKLLAESISDSYARAGFLFALNENRTQSDARYTDMLIQANTLLGGLPPGDGPEWNAFFAGRYAAIRDKAALAELVRRATHRDGSTWSIVTGAAALDLLERVSATSPDVAMRLKAESGVDVGQLQFGIFPSLAATPASGDLPASSLVVAATPASAPVFVNLTVSRLGDGLAIDGAPITVTEAIRLAEALLDTVWQLTVPAEGYDWIDHLGGTGGRLFCSDPAIFNAAKYPQKDDVYVAAEVFQSDGTGDEPIGTFRAELYGTSPNQSLFSRVADYNDAKVRVANAVRPTIPKV